MLAGRVEQESTFLSAEGESKSGLAAIRDQDQVFNHPSPRHAERFRFLGAAVSCLKQA